MTAQDDRDFRARLLTGEDAASAAGVSPVTLRRWAQRGLLTNHGSRRRALYDVDELVAALDAPKPRETPRHAARHAGSLTSLTAGGTLTASQPDVSARGA